MFKLMEENFGGVKHGSFHEVTVPDNCKNYSAFAFVRNPYSRAVAIYHMLSDPGDGSDLMRLINHELYKREVEDLEFETFCSWLGNCPEESFVYECSTSQYDHLRDSNIANIYTIKIDELPLQHLNDYLCDKDLPMVYSLPHELERDHEDFQDLANDECVKLINSWAEQDFINYKYEKLL
jgi:hypothetical protein